MHRTEYKTENPLASWEEPFAQSAVSLRYFSDFVKLMLNDIEPYCWTCSEIENECLNCPLE